MLDSRVLKGGRSAVRALLARGVIAAAASVVAALPAHGQAPTSLVESDSALIDYLKRHDPVLRNFLLDCARDTVIRGNLGDRVLFSYYAECGYRRQPEQVVECDGYFVEASGIIDDAVRATVQQWRLRLSCPP